MGNNFSMDLKGGWFQDDSSPLSEEALQIVVKRREAKSNGEKERYSHLNAEFQRIARRDKNICKSMADSCQCMTKTTTIL